MRELENVLLGTGVTLPVSGDYPQGEQQDDPGSGAGTIISNALLKDWMTGITYAAVQGGVVRNGLFDNVTNGFQVLEGLIRFIDKIQNEGFTSDIIPTDPQDAPLPTTISDIQFTMARSGAIWAINGPLPFPAVSFPISGLKEGVIFSAVANADYNEGDSFMGQPINTTGGFLSGQLVRFTTTGTSVNAEVQPEGNKVERSSNQKPQNDNWVLVAKSNDEEPLDKGVFRVVGGSSHQGLDPVYTDIPIFEIQYFYAKGQTNVTYGNIKQIAGWNIDPNYTITLQDFRIYGAQNQGIEIYVKTNTPTTDNGSLIVTRESGQFLELKNDSVGTLNPTPPAGYLDLTANFQKEVQGTNYILDANGYPHSKTQPVMTVSWAGDNTAGATFTGLDVVFGFTWTISINPAKTQVSLSFESNIPVMSPDNYQMIAPNNIADGVGVFIFPAEFSVNILTYVISANTFTQTSYKNILNIYRL